jgi:hypothetical protein
MKGMNISSEAGVKLIEKYATQWLSDKLDYLPLLSKVLLLGS